MNDIIRDLIGGITMKSVGLVASLYVCLVFLNLLYKIKFYSTLLIYVCIVISQCLCNSRKFCTLPLFH